MQEKIFNSISTKTSSWPCRFDNFISLLHPETALSTKCGENFKTTVSSDDMVPFIDDNIVTNVVFGCGIIFNHEALTKVERVNRELKTISRSCQSLKCIPCEDQPTYFFFIRGIPLTTHTNYGTWVRQLFFQSTTLLIEILWPFNILKYQLTNFENTQRRSFLHYGWWTKKGKACKSTLHFLHTANPILSSKT